MTPPATCRRRRGHTFVRVTGGILLCATAATTRAGAHLLPPDLPFYGPYTAGSVHCLRVISWATQRCFKRVMTLQRQCADAALTGNGCDAGGRDAQIAAAQHTARSAIAATCAGGQLTELSFSSLDEAQTDAARACADQATATMSIAYAPVGRAPAHTAPAACMALTAAASQKLLRVSVRGRSRAFDRMATRLIGPAKKIAMMARVDADIAAAAHTLAAQIDAACPSFGSVYGSAAPALLATLRARAACIVNGTYVQSVVTCPTPVCGNGVQESGEQCDDGNTVDGDGCGSTCTVEASPPGGGH